MPWTHNAKRPTIRPVEVHRPRQNRRKKRFWMPTNVLPAKYQEIIWKSINRTFPYSRKQSEDSMIES